MAGAWLAGLSACAGDKAGTDESRWDGGIYHIEVELDTADPLSDADNGVTATVGTISDLVRERLYLDVRQINEGSELNDGGQPIADLLVEDMQVWVGDWYAELLTPIGDTYFSIGATVEEGEVDIGFSYDSIFCSAGNEDALRSTEGEVVSVDLEVTCVMWSRGGYGFAPTARAARPATRARSTLSTDLSRPPRCQ